MTIIAGVDVSRNAVSVCLLSEVPTDIKRWAKQHKAKKYESTAEGVMEFLDLPFEVAVMEPTGGHYSKLWARLIERSKRTVRWVGHWEIASYRESWKLFSKTDDSDALALACYGIERGDRPSMFLAERSLIGLQLRELQLQREFLNRINNPLANRIRQQLCHELPELYDREAGKKWAANPSGLWKAIAGTPSTKWAKEIENSIGSGLSPFSNSIGRLLVSVEEAEAEIERAIDQLLIKPELEPYVRAAEPYYFGKATLCTILSTIYPLDRFDGSSNPLGAFKLSCGMGLIWRKSGDFEGWIPGGDASVRRSLWRWAFTVVTQKSGRLSSPQLDKLRNYYQNGSTVSDTEESKHYEAGKGNQRLMRVARRAITMYYREVKAELK